MIAVLDGRRSILRSHGLTRGAALVVLTVLLGWMVSSTLPGLGHAYPFWPSAGIAVALVIADGPRLLPAVAAGSLLFNLSLENSAPLLAVVLAAGSTLQTAVAASLGRRLASSRPALRESREILAFLLAIGPLSCLIGAGVSVLAAHYSGALIPAELPRAGFTWWAGDVLGVVVMTPATLMLLPEMQDLWEGRRVKVLLPSLLLVLAIQLAYAQAALWNREAVRLGLRSLAVDAAHQITSDLDRHAEAINSIRRYVLASDAIDAKEFKVFTRDVFTRLPGLQGLSWNPVIAESQRERFERQQADDPMLGEYRIRERGPDGFIRPVSRRLRYVPVALIEPLEANRNAVGFDILSNPLRADAIRKAEASGLMRATEPISLIQEQGSQNGVLVLDPVKSASGELRGFAVGVYRLGDLLTSSFADVHAERWQGMELVLRHPGRVGPDAILARYGDSAGGEGGQGAADQAWRMDVPIDFGGQRWLVSMLPSRDALIRRQSSLPQQLLFACLILLILNQAFLLLITGRDQVERRQAMVDRHLASHDPLTNLLNRRAFLAALEFARSEAEMKLGQHALLAFDLDHFKPINDDAGHAAGDRVLSMLAHCLLTHVRQDDIVARLGGDEFAIILRHCDPGESVVIAGKVLSAIAALEIVEAGRTFRVTASLGLRPLPSTAVPLPPAAQLLREADQASYAAKRQGGNQLVMAAYQ